MQLKLREHQDTVIDALRQGFKDGYRTQLLYAPTGFGKTEVAIALMQATASKEKKAAMVMDRIVLVDQTSDRLDKYQIPHGVFQSNHWRYNTFEKLQVCSAQTLEQRSNFPTMDLLIVDECHITRKQTAEFIKSNPQVKVIGLTATPFTKGLGNLYQNVVCGATTEYLVNNKWLAPLRVYVAKEIDMTGVKKLAGEWAQDEVTKRGMQITGDIVEEWSKKTHEVFGRPRKTIVFCAGVEHGADLVKQFANKGYNFISISYRDNDEYKKAAIEDFAKPDTEIHGLIATDILTRGFDVPDVMIGVSARPFSKSLSSHIQQMGRIMRICEGKEFGLWLDHSGNFLRFRDDWEQIYTCGVSQLDKIIEKTKKEPTEKFKEDAKCPNCGLLWGTNALSCSGCGYVRQRRNEVVSVSGELEELISVGKAVKEDKQQFYSELLYIARKEDYDLHWASYKYREKFGVWPRGLHDNGHVPSIQTMKWVRGQNIRWAKRKR